MNFLTAFYHAAANDFAIAALPLTDFGVKQRGASRRQLSTLDCSDRSKDRAAARQAALQALLTT